MDKEFVGRHLDQWIAIYFADVRSGKAKCSLGAWLAEVLPKVGNTEALKWIADGGGE
jgi:hypothetical protein